MQEISSTRPKHFRIITSHRGSRVPNLFTSDSDNTCLIKLNMWDSMNYTLLVETISLLIKISWNLLEMRYPYPQSNRELKQTRRRRKREHHLKMWLRVSAIIFQLFKLIMLEKCVLTILELNWNQRLGHKATKLNICHYMLTSSTQLQNWSFHVVERTRTSSKCQKMKMHVQSVQKYCFSLSNMQICAVFVAVVVVVA